MKYVVGFLAGIVFNIFFSGNVLALATVPTEPFPITSPLIITAYSTSPDLVSLDFVQIYNNSDSVVVLDGWQLAYTTTLDASKLSFVALQGYMLPNSHHVFALSNGLSGVGVDWYAVFSLPAGAKLKSLVLLPPAGISQSEQPIAGSGIYKRNLVSTGYSTSTTFTKQDPLVFTSLAADPLYKIPDVPQLKIVEILPRSADCAPNDTSLVCGDYVKLQNTSDTNYDASNYRLRTDSSTSESSNALPLDFMLKPGQFLTVNLKQDGQGMSLTDSGGYVWLEDVMGLRPFYDETMVSYPSASSSTKQGWAWALGSDGIWQWTSTPQPDAQNIVTLPIEEVAPITTIESECPAGKYRNPETNRCKNIEEAIATLISCDEGQYRSPETNRCRSIVTVASAVLAPCDVGEERNPATNRCRSAVNGLATTLADCPVGQERNPDTNRCRKIVSSPTAVAFTEPGGDKNIFSSYWLGGAVAAGAIGYGVYEWRFEIMKLFRKIVPTSK